jgi:hypothetical protein
MRCDLVAALTSLAALLHTALRIEAQDLQFECILCADKFDKCEIDCSWNLLGKNASDVDDCQAACKEERDLCVDDDAAVACSHCTISCAETYESDMRKCLSLVSRDSKSTYGDSLSACEVKASYLMETCITACSPNADFMYEDRKIEL